MLKRSFSTARIQNTRYGFIGLGRMGINMAKNLETKIDPAKDELHLYDINSKAYEEFKGSNTISQPNVVEVTKNSDVIITMLPEGKHVRQVYGEIARNEYTGAPKLFIDSTTLDVKTSLETGKLLKQNKIGNYVDAPVSGGVIGATNATLTFMVGAKDISNVEPILKMLGKRVVACGELGSGISAKLCNNYLLALNNLATAEAYHLAQCLNLDMDIFNDIINTSTGKCWSSEVNCPVPGLDPKTPSSKDYNGGFGITLMNKDFKLAMDAAKLYDCPLPMSQQAVEIYDEVSNNEEFKPKDMSVVYKWLEGKTEK